MTTKNLLRGYCHRIEEFLRGASEDEVEELYRYEVIETNSYSYDVDECLEMIVEHCRYLKEKRR